MMGVRFKVAFIIAVVCAMVALRPREPAIHKMLLDDSYRLKPLVAPPLSGFILQALVRLSEVWPWSALVTEQIKADSHVEVVRQFAAQLDMPPTFFPRVPGVATEGTSAAAFLEANPSETSYTHGFRFFSVDDFALSFRNGSATPLEVAKQALRAVAADKSNAIIDVNEKLVLQMAEESTARFKNGQPLGLLDGVPVTIKDELDVQGYKTRVGTSFLGESVAETDSRAAARLRGAGAVLLGKANMHELGMGVTGFNAHYGSVKNPYNSGRHTGGSSSGSAAAVGLGLCPLAIGADGGGSIRIPSSLCGVVGLKATLGRISEHGAFPLCWTVGHVGPIGATVRDVAAGYAAVAGEDAHDPSTIGQPPVVLPDGPVELKGLRIGVYWDNFNDANAEVVASCKSIVDQLVGKGAVLKSITLPHLAELANAHFITIVSEMATSMDKYHSEHEQDYSAEVRLGLSIARSLSARDYVAAQQVRTYFMAMVAELFSEVDVLITPMTAITAPPIPSIESSNVTLTSEIMRFVQLGNFAGIPGITLPVGYDRENMPIGLQVQAAHWREDLLLGVGYAVEELVERQRPEAYYNLINP